MNKCSNWSVKGCPASQYLSCSVYKKGLNCWEATESIPCCKRNDKSRCGNCDIYKRAEVKTI